MDTAEHDQPTTEAIVWDASSASRAREVLDALNDSEAWNAYLHGFGTFGDQMVRVSIGELTAVIRWRVQN